MDALILKFFRAARGAGIRISPAEGIDAANAVSAVGYNSRQMLRDTLLLTVAKTEDEKKALAECFDLFFRRDEQFGAEDEAEGDELSDDQQDEQGQDPGQGESEGQGQSQGQGRGQEPGQDEAQRPAAAQNQDLGPLARMLLSNDRSALAQAMNAAADAVNLQEIQFFTQRGIYSNRILQQMGAARLQRDIATLTAASDARTQRLMNAREALREAVREMVNRAILLYTREGTENLRNEILRNTALNNLERRDVERTRTLVRTIARRLRDRYSKPRKRKNRGRPRYPKNHPPQRHLGRHSVHHGVEAEEDRQAAHRRAVRRLRLGRARRRFLLLFLYSLSEAVQDIRTFAFAGNLIEVSEKLNENHIEDAMKEVLKEIGFGSSDYGQSLVDFEENFMDSITNRTTVIILGDGRTNNLDPRTDILRRISERAKRVIWLNPEARFSWGVGDSEMPRYEPYCTLARPCGTVMQLERVVSDIMAMDRH